MDKFIRVDNELYVLIRRLFGAVTILSLLTLGIAAVVGGSFTVWVRGIIVLVIGTLLIRFAGRAYNGSRGAYRRMRLMASIAPIAIVAIIAIPHDGFPAWVKVEQALVGILLATAATMLARDRVRRAYRTVDSEPGTLAR
jgi:xanthine/uracil permease